MESNKVMIKQESTNKVKRSIPAFRALNLISADRLFIKEKKLVPNSTNLTRVVVKLDLFFLAVIPKPSVV